MGRFTADLPSGSITYAHLPPVQIYAESLPHAYVLRENGVEDKIGSELTLGHFRIYFLDAHVIFLGVALHRSLQILGDTVYVMLVDIHHKLVVVENVYLAHLLSCGDVLPEFGSQCAELSGVGGAYIEVVGALAYELKVTAHVVEALLHHADLH